MPRGEQVKAYLLKIVKSDIWNNRMVLSWWMALWLLVLMEIVFIPFAGGVYWRIESLSPVLKISIFLQTILLWVAFLLPFAGVGAALSLPTWLLRKPLHKKIARTARTVILINLVTYMLIFYFTSWTIFMGETTRFVGYDGLNFLSSNRGMLIEHIRDMEQETLILGTIVSLVLAAGFVLLVPYLAGKPTTGTTKRILATSALVVLFSSLFVPITWSAGSITPQLAVLYPDEKLPLRNRAGYCRRERANPLTKMTVEYFSDAGAAASEGPPLILDPIKEKLHKIISIDKYLEDVDRSKLQDYNVIILIFESLRADRLKSLGSKRVVVPAVDELAKESRVFRYAYTQSSHSDYADLCPLASLYPLRSRYHHYYPKEIPYPRVLLYDILKPLGYRTAIFSSQNEYWGMMYYFLNTGNLDIFFHSDSYKGELLQYKEDHGFYNFCKKHKTRAGKVDDKFTVDAAIKWIDKDPDKPFFIYMNLQRSHFPYRVPEDFKKPFEPSTIDFTARFGSYPRSKVPIMINAYDNSLNYVDTQVKRVIDHLREKDILKKTILVITGDTGQAFYEHGQSCHSCKLYDEVMRVGLVFHAPGIQPGIDERYVQHVDVPPTVLGILNLPPHPSYQGVDVFGKTDLKERSIFLTVQTTFAKQDAIVRGGCKFIHDHDYKRYLLYDLEDDPGEKYDIINSSRGRAALLRQRLKKFFDFQIQYHKDPALYKKYYAPKFN